MREWVMDSIGRLGCDRSIECVMQLSSMCEITSNKTFSYLPIGGGVGLIISRGWMGN